MNNLKHFAIITLAALILLIPAFAFSDEKTPLPQPSSEDAIDQELKWLQSETYVITASRVMEEITKAPASITVITDRQIEQMGARNLMDVFRAVPGFEAIKYYMGWNIISVRGSFAGYTLFLMINNHPVYEPFTGGAGGSGGIGGGIYDRLMLENVKRIEFIRGPGSALYGANAFTHIINVITKDAKDIDGIELTAKGGKFNTQEYNLLFGDSFYNLEIAFNFNYFKTHGFRGNIEEDFQTYLDKLFEPLFPVLSTGPASLAPGRMASDEATYDTSVTLKLNAFTLDGKYMVGEAEPPVGHYGALNNGSTIFSQDYHIVLGYEDKIYNNISFSGKIYTNFTARDLDLQDYPPGYISNTPGGYTVFPEGLLFHYGYDCRRNGIELQSSFQIQDVNTLVTGITYDKQQMYNTSLGRNFSSTDNPAVIIPLPSFTRYPKNFWGNWRREFAGIYVENIWDVTTDLRLTTGARYDKYNDFGSHLSPRAGVTWEYLNGYDIKLLYGHAYHAASFIQCYETTFGNPDLKPEVINTYEVSFGARPISSLNSRITFFHSKVKDAIILVSHPEWEYKNEGSSESQGFELEAKHNLGRGTYVGANYNFWQRKTSNDNSNYALYGYANIRFSKYLNLYSDFIYKGNRYRFTEPIDPRPSLPDYYLFNLSLISKISLKKNRTLEITSSIYNLFDKNYSYDQGEPDRLPYDLPAPGRSYLIEAKLAL